MKARYVIPFEEIGKDDFRLVSKKCANLGEMLKIGMPATPGFALSIEAHKLFMEETRTAHDIKQYMSGFPDGLKNMEQYQQASKAIYEILESKKMPSNLKDKILKEYGNLCKKCDTDSLSVAVRSAGTVSHPGQYETFLNVKGESEVLKKIVEVWASAYNVRSIAAVSQKGLSLTESPHIGVAVMRIIEARSAGVIFTVHPTTGDTSQIVIEGSWGMGESVVSGAVTPDKYILNKSSLDVEEKIVGSKLTQMICVDQGIVEEEVPVERQEAFCLEDAEVKKIAELAMRLETYFGTPQDSEWAVDRQLPFPENIFYMQTRPQVAIVQKKNTTDQIVDLMLSRMLGS
ncbi:pyruvate phosphate dikinase, PEP/pyruvate binding domain protein [delta proteobacterium NaphS2]|nr:pyruvate phosphate dikinase, PEP/pyruvate binding domain protein [delta proteobacterium NaphS2]